MTPQAASPAPSRLIQSAARTKLRNTSDIPPKPCLAGGSMRARSCQNTQHGLQGPGRASGRRPAGHPNPPSGRLALRLQEAVVCDPVVQPVSPGYYGMRVRPKIEGMPDSCVDVELRRDTRLLEA